jgi:hypothetical protein
MKSISLLFAALLLCRVAGAGPIADQFQGGFNGATWASSIDSLVGMFPPGEHVFATTPGGRAYWIKDQTPLLNVPRDGQSILFGFNEQDLLESITLGFAFDRKEQVLGTLISAFGAATSSGFKGTKSFNCWKPDAKIALCFWASKEAKHGISWLTIYGPNYDWRQVKAPSNTSLERTRERSSAKLARRRARRSAQPLDRRRVLLIVVVRCNLEIGLAALQHRHSCSAGRVGGTAELYARLRRYRVCM